jgi:hydroxymethylglutaryl-CoA reductase (NADPH)
MVTIATHKACKYINNNYKCDTGFRYYIESNFNGDKNPAYKSLLLGRSHYVVGSALIKGKFLRRVLRVSAKEYVDGWMQCTRGSQEAGIFGMNMHVANALTAIYLATGQDAASVVENAGGSISYEVRDSEDLFATITNALYNCWNCRRRNKIKAGKKKPGIFRVYRQRFIKKAC